MPFHKKLLTRILVRVRDSVLDVNYRLDNYREVIWLIGNGRSGTTWAADLVNHNKGYREMFEPFHPHLVDGMGFLKLHQYVRPDDSNPELEAIAADVFSGRFRHPSVDQGNRSLIYRGLLIKDIFANLFARWVSLRFPQVKIVLLMRNPFAVALSTYRKRDWIWATDPLDLLNQTALHEDYLRPFEDLIRKTSRDGDYVLRQILIWAIINYVPLRQFRPGEIHICFYEDLINHPNQEVTNILRFAKLGTPVGPVDIAREILDRPSRVSDQGSSSFAQATLNCAWKNELSARQIDTGLEILRSFGFDGLYDQNSLPDRQVIARIQEQGAGAQASLCY